MNKKISLGAVIAILAVVAAAVFSMTMTYANQTFNAKTANLREREKLYSKFAEINRLVLDNYLKNVDENALLDSVAQGFVKGIGDEYAVYYDAKAYEKILKDADDQQAGIGAVLTASPDGYLQVGEVYPESPAQIAGIKEGDIIVKVDETDLTMENTQQMASDIQGDAGTKVVLVVRSGGEDSTKELTRRHVEVPTVYSRMLPDTQVAYLRITRFSDYTSDQFNTELQKMLDQGAQSLIFDVRDNPGGSMAATMRILDKLLPSCVIASATYRNNTTEVLATSDANQIQMPMTILVNGNTSCEAELFAIAIKDEGGGRLVGSTTKGKGILQKELQLEDGSAIKISVAYLNPPKSPAFHEVGIKPDFDVVMPAEMEKNWMNLDETVDPQLKKAVEVAVTTMKTGAQAESSSGVSSAG
ncbi:S41 family peptidase [Oscillospiraceae bacterium MB08-C2-2]|nr:S41 family peptidase [Oscillospiraceae bacterium MB08-C2-2]